MSSTNGLTRDGPSLRIAAVIVAYQPDADRYAELVRAIGSQVHGVVIVDNTPASAAVDAELPDLPHAVIRNGRNLGLAAAQNQGIRWAIERGFTHVFMLDQDSLPAPDCVARLLDAEANLKRTNEALATLGARVVDSRTGHEYSFKRFTLTGVKHARCSSSSSVVAADFVIASGSLTSVESLRKVGLMDEGLFIDRVDIDWCLRARKAGLRTYGVCGAVLRHLPGKRVRRVWLGRWKEISLQSPERTYYMIRNSLVLYRRKYAGARWILNDGIWLLGTFVLSLLLEPARARRVRLAWKGIRDGLSGRQGALAVDEA